MLDGSGRVLRAGSYLNGGGICIEAADRRSAEAISLAQAAEMFGEDHPCVAMSRKWTESMMREQCQAGMTLATIMDDGRRFSGPRVCGRR